MSSQSQLTPYARSDADDLPAAGGQRVVDASAWDLRATTATECINCGGHVSADVTRVLGRDGVSRVCYDCADHWQVNEGAAAGLEVRESRRNSLALDGDER